MGVCPCLLEQQSSSATEHQRLYVTLKDPVRSIVVFQALAQTSVTSSFEKVTAVGFEPTPLRTGSQRLGPLGQTVLLHEAKRAVIVLTQSALWASCRPSKAHTSALLPDGHDLTRLKPATFGSEEERLPDALQKTAIIGRYLWSAPVHANHCRSQEAKKFDLLRRETWLDAALLKASAAATL